MKTIETYSDDKIRYGIERCRARLSGILPYGLMKNETFTREALKEYEQELERRGQKQLDFQ
ncbi:MAG: hypothetical protein ACK5M3_05355 [Dysgonomonas sp.]